jgi:hypothetical protein
VWGAPPSCFLGETVRGEAEEAEVGTVPVVTVLTLERIVQRPPMEVFDFVATHHFDNHPRWDPDVLEMTQTSPGPVESA